jgi:tripartite-type tricarboxylate transporter receptor subunit TctC
MATNSESVPGASVLIERRRLLMMACGATAGFALPSLGRAASDYPNKMLRVLIPYPAGGPTDIVARVVGPRLSEVLQQPVVLENRGGASGMIGADIVAKAPHDGYTLLINVSGQLVNPALYVKMPHDPLKDFAPITNLASTPIQLVVRADSPINTVKDLVDLIHAQPGQHSFASSSVGTPGHLAGEVFKVAAKLDSQHVPYKGSAPALSDVIGGQVTYMLDSMPSSINLVKGGKLRSLAITSAQRSKMLPQTPTFAEAGYAEVNLSTWYGMWAPAGTPSAVVEQIYAAVSKILVEPEIKARLEAVQLDPVGDTPTHFAAYCQSEALRYAAIVKTAGIHLE